MNAPAPTELLKLAERLEIVPLYSAADLTGNKRATAFRVDTPDKQSKEQRMFLVAEESRMLIVAALRQAASVERAEVAGEAVAWLYESWNGGDSWGKHFSFDKPAGNQWQRNIVPLYASPSRSEGVSKGEVQIAALRRMAGHDPRDPGLSWDDDLLLIQSAAQAAKDVLAGLSLPVAQASPMPPEPYWLPFKVAGSCIRDAKDNYVAELSSPFGGDVRDQMANFLVAAANASPVPSADGGTAA